MKQPNETHRGPLLRKEINRLATRPVVMFLLCCLSAVFLFNAVAFTVERIEKSAWPTTDGTIVLGELEFVTRDGHRGIVGIDYRVRYSVEGQVHFGEQASIDGTVVSDVVNFRHQVGDTVTVFYDSRRPSDALIYPTAWSAEIMQYLACVLLLSCWYSVFRKPRKGNPRVATAA